MLSQNYIRVYENNAGSVTLVVGSDESIEQIELQSISIEYEDLKAIAKDLIAISKENEA